MHSEPQIALNCPYCEESIYETLSWFKKSYSTCPSCEKGLVAGQFATLLANLELAMDASIEEMLNGQPHTGCCGQQSESSDQRESSCGKGTSCC